jgi:hypothetical protein
MGICKTGFYQFRLRVRAKKNKKIIINCFVPHEYFYLHFKFCALLFESESYVLVEQIYQITITYHYQIPLSLASVKIK